MSHLSASLSLSHKPLLPLPALPFSPLKCSDTSDSRRNNVQGTFSIVL